MSKLQNPQDLPTLEERETNKFNNSRKGMVVLNIINIFFLTLVSLGLDDVPEA